MITNGSSAEIAIGPVRGHCLRTIVWQFPLYEPAFWARNPISSEAHSGNSHHHVMDDSLPEDRSRGSPKHEYKASRSENKRAMHIAVMLEAPRLIPHIGQASLADNGTQLGPLKE